MSPALSNSSIQEVSASNDNFSLTEDGDGKRIRSHRSESVGMYRMSCQKEIANYSGEMMDLRETYI